MQMNDLREGVPATSTPNEPLLNANANQHYDNINIEHHNVLNNNDVEIIEVSDDALPNNVLEIKNEIFSSNQCAIIRGDESNIKTMQYFQTIIDDTLNNMIPLKKKLYGRATLFFVILFCVFLILRIVTSHSMYIAFMVACAIIGSFPGVKYYKLLHMNATKLWQSKAGELRAIKFNAQNDEIEYLCYGYGFGDYPNIKQISMKCLQRYKVCLISDLVRITHKIGGSNSNNNYISFHYKPSPDSNDVLLWQYSFIYKKDKKVAVTYKACKDLLNRVKPGWKNPNAVQFMYKKFVNEI